MIWFVSTEFYVYNLSHMSMDFYEIEYIFIDHTMHILLFIVSALILKVSLVRAISAESQKLDYVSFPGGGVQHAD